MRASLSFPARERARSSFTRASTSQLPWRDHPLPACAWRAHSTVDAQHHSPKVGQAVVSNLPRCGATSFNRPVLMGLAYGVVISDNRAALCVLGQRGAANSSHTVPPGHRPPVLLVRSSEVPPVNGRDRRKICPWFCLVVESFRQANQLASCQSF
jgi:hypothetical protein